MSLVIPSRFNGPPGSGNGGYACGLFASLVEGDAEVTLRTPPPLDTPLGHRSVDDGFEMVDGDTLVAQVRGTEVDLDIPTAPSLDQAEQGRGRYRGYEHHEFPTCFTCGTERSDGLAIHPGPVFGTGIVASPWIADESLPSHDGSLAPEVVWAALDCPGAWATMREDQPDPVVLGRMSAHLVAPVPLGTRLVSYGWRTGADGRKAYAGTAIADDRGTVLGYARQVWIALRAV